MKAKFKNEFKRLADKMVNKNKFLVSSVFLLVIFLGLMPFAFADDGYVCGVYFTGIGCPHCANAKPTIDAVLNSTPNLVLIRYEVYQESANAPVLDAYASAYGVRAAIPLILFGNGSSLQGDSPIINDLAARVASLQPNNHCPLIGGSSVGFSQCNFSSLPGKPEVFLGSSSIPLNGSCQVPVEKPQLTLAKILSLAAVDAVNPCEFAVLLLMLVSILNYNPTNKKKVLLAGLAFALSIFIMYFIYGIIIVKFFQVIQGLTTVKLVLYKILAVAAIILGLLNIRDFVSYKPGRIATEMPVMFRPKVKKLISKVTSPGGAFIVGIFVTFFLTPCTMGPYLIAGGILSSIEFVKTLPWLALYNLVFILPMIIITLIVYGGLSSVENLSGWKEHNIRYMHLVAGVIMVLLGLIMLFGLI